MTPPSISDSAHDQGDYASLSQPRRRFLGRTAIDIWETLSGLASLAFLCIITACTKAPAHSARLGPGIRRQIALSGVNLLPWATLLSAGLGLVVVGQMLGVFTGLGAPQYLGAILVSTVVHELGPIVVGVLVLSIAGTATVIDLGTHRVLPASHSQTHPARDTLRQIVLPRVIGFGFATLCLAIYFITLTLLFAYLIVFLQNAPLTPDAFITNIADALTWEPFVLLVVKAFGFGAIIGVVACYEGYLRPISLEQLSRATIRTVVEGIILCGLVDSLSITYLLL